MIVLFVVTSLALTTAYANEAQISQLERKVTLLSRQLMMQQLFNEERIRSDGNSGVKRMRQRNDGTRPYYSDSFSGLSFLSNHDHANHRTTVGLGELVAVLNGVEFRTRHNDYGLYRPSTTSNDYHKVEEIPFPDVPPQVLAKGSVKEQIDEMREWFKAFQENDRSKRDYRKYFKPVLCYLEGAWTLTDPEKSIEEPFKSDRHFLMAHNWNELHRKVRFMSYTGSKNDGENLAFLPTSIIDMKNDTDPVFAQWNYRILCHPLRKSLDKTRLRVIDDLGNRMAFTRTLDVHAQSRSARFQINPTNANSFKEGHTTYTFLDQLMGEIPGKDNYRRNLRDESFDVTSLSYTNAKKNLNAAYYHRWYQVNNPGANGRLHIHRSFSDNNVFMAMNTRSQVVEQTVNDQCKSDRYGVKTCAKSYKQRWSYAIPLEIIYLTPLHEWNPYDIEYSSTAVEDKKRKGGMTKATAFDGTHSKQFFRTPSEFFQSIEDKGDAADTSGGKVGVLNKKGDLCSVMASGVYNILPEIQGVGRVRMRYPIAPVHQEGDALWKEVSALRDIVLLQEERFKRIREEFGMATNLETPANGEDGHAITLSMQYAPATDKTKSHTHTVTLTPKLIEKLQKGEIGLTTSEAGGHTHALRIKYDKKSKTPYVYVKCDAKMTCPDGHGEQLHVVDN